MSGLSSSQPLTQVRVHGTILPQAAYWGHELAWHCAMNGETNEPNEVSYDSGHTYKYFLYWAALWRLSEWYQQQALEEVRWCSCYFTIWLTDCRNDDDPLLRVHLVHYGRRPPLLRAHLVHYGWEGHRYTDDKEFHICRGQRGVYHDLSPEINLG